MTLNLVWLKLITDRHIDPLDFELRHGPLLVLFINLLAQEIAKRPLTPSLINGLSFVLSFHDCRHFYLWERHAQSTADLMIKFNRQLVAFDFGALTLVCILCMCVFSFLQIPHVGIQSF